MCEQKKKNPASVDAGAEAELEVVNFKAKDTSKPSSFAFFIGTRKPIPLNRSGSVVRSTRNAQMGNAMAGARSRRASLRDDGADVNRDRVRTDNL